MVLNDASFCDQSDAGKSKIASRRLDEPVRESPGPLQGVGLRGWLFWRVRPRSGFGEA